MRITWTTERGACVVGDDRVKYVWTMRDVIVRRGAAARGPAVWRRGIDLQCTAFISLL